MAKEEEYKEMFLAEAEESYEELNRLFTELEKNNESRPAIDAIFRITHTLKGNAMGMGFDAIAELSHVMEDIFNEVKLRRVTLDSVLFQSLFRANDILGDLIQAVKTGTKVRYKGIRTKLQVALRKAKAYHEAENEKNPVKTEEALTNKTNATENPLDKAEKKLAEDLLLSEPNVFEEEEGENKGHKIILSDMVQVPVRKLDELLNIVGELIIEKDTLIAQRAAEKGMNSDMARLHRLTSDLQYSVMDVRLVQVGFLFNKFHRVLRDAAVIEHKKVDLVLEGTESEIDRNVLKTMSDSLVHLVRNSVGHGIEPPEERLKLGKPEQGTVTLRARNEKDTVYIEISDDGHGVDVDKIKKKAVAKGLIPKEYAPIISREEILLCLFEPGFSNAEVVTEISGRGVGLDVVRMAVESIGGKISVETELGKGTTFTLGLPSSMAVKAALLFQLDQQEFAIALAHTEAVISMPKEEIHKINTGLIATYLGKTISIVFLKDLFDLESMKDLDAKGSLHKHFDQMEDSPNLDIVIVSYNNRLVGLVVDKLMQQKEIVEKKLPSPIDNVALFSGVTILGTGRMCLVLDIVSILSHLFKEKRIGTNIATLG
ncbi:MAG: Signal transduction histidine kinase CheA (EC [uncultured Aureispira sp.]|uniref:histidine kinase n=1 Tax=uncultured Aureispira sp. TaxID=1331704 RepID=A0A6S6S545_9BACT|nr:MAG: Signal transduction histidine kinase CheA (EC [uncultured Aureispira sp.]